MKDVIAIKPKTRLRIKTIRRALSGNNAAIVKATVIKASALTEKGKINATSEPHPRKPKHIGINTLTKFTASTIGKNQRRNLLYSFFDDEVKTTYKNKIAETSPVPMKKGVRIRSY